MKNSNTLTEKMGKKIAYGQGGRFAFGFFGIVHAGLTYLPLAILGVVAAVLSYMLVTKYASRSIDFITIAVSLVTTLILFIRGGVEDVDFVMYALCLHGFTSAYLIISPDYLTYLNTSFDGIMNRKKK